ncbi:hypothetical protein SESBI_04540 [Sesbania bispinosa]|nr:hypothetical protein SESBI_04540 [Sesbania bispinosa]
MSFIQHHLTAKAKRDVRYVLPHGQTQRSLSQKMTLFHTHTLTIVVHLFSSLEYNANCCSVLPMSLWIYGAKDTCTITFIPFKTTGVAAVEGETRGENEEGKDNYEANKNFDNVT